VVAHLAAVAEAPPLRVGQLLRDAPEVPPTSSRSAALALRAR
jgi:hypothetical protein